MKYKGDAMMAKTPQSNADLQLASMLVTKILRKMHFIEKGPTIRDYAIITEGTRYHDRPDIRVNVDLGRGSRSAYRTFGTRPISMSMTS